jgi:hypothetical protein
MTVHRSILFAALAVASAPSAARADTEQPIAPERSHLRLGIGGAVGGLGYTDLFGVGPGLYARLGYGVSDRFAVDLDASGGSILVSGFARAALLAVFTPTDARSYAIGPTMSGFYTIAYPGADGPSSGVAVGGTARIDFHTSRRWVGDHRSALTFGVALDVGVVPAPYKMEKPQPEAGLVLTIGRSRY